MRKNLLIVALCSIATNLFAYDFEANRYILQYQVQ